VPPGIDAGKVDLGKAVQLFNVPPAELALMKVDALITIKTGKENGIDPFTFYREMGYRTDNTGELVDAIVYHKLLDEAKAGLERFEDCVGK